MKNVAMLTAAALAALLSLAACDSQPQKVGRPDDPQAEALKNRPAVQLPASIQESRTYRCRDNSIVYVNVLTDGTVNVRSVEDEPPSNVLRRQTPEGPFVGDGFSLSGTGPDVTFSSPDVPQQTCRSGPPS